MEINQAFEILKSAGGTRAARIMTLNHDTMPALRVFWAARQLRRGVPVAKLVRQKWFYGMPFYTDKNTLDPRPDTETLVEAVLKDTSSIIHHPLSILDLGTGTGCIIAAITGNMPGASGVGIDKSWPAVRIARKNMRDLKLNDRVKIARGDFGTGDWGFGTEKFDIVVSNPPYIARRDKRVNRAATFDPAVALYADNNGMAAYESIAKNAKEWLKPGGNVYLEIGVDMGADVKKVFQSHGWKFQKSWNDLSGIERVLSFKV